MTSLPPVPAGAGGRARGGRRGARGRARCEPRHPARGRHHGRRDAGLPDHRPAAHDGAGRGPRASCWSATPTTRRTRCPTSSTSCCSAVSSRRSSCRCWCTPRSATGTAASGTPSGWPPSPSPAWRSSPCLAILVAPLLTSLYGITDDPDQVRPGQLAGPDPAGRDRLLRHRRARPGDPELAGRVRPAGLGAGAQQRRRHRHRAAVHRRLAAPGDLDARPRSPRARSGCWASAPRSASPSRRSCCSRCCAGPGCRCGRAGG